MFRTLLLRALIAVCAVTLAGEYALAASGRSLRGRLWGQGSRHASAPAPRGDWALHVARAAPPAPSAQGVAGELPVPPDAARLATDWALAHGFELAVTPAEDRLLVDMADGRLERMSLWDATLVASQVRDDDKIALYRTTLDAWVQRCRGSVQAASGAQARATVVFEYMHREILRGGYQVDSSDFVQLLERGQFNCVSSALLFGGLCERFSLPVTAVELPGHCYCVLKLRPQPIDVETTCPRWFAVHDDPSLREQLVERTLGVAIDRDKQGRREVPLAALVGTIYYNRGVDCLKRQQFAPALAANVKALRIDEGSTAAWGNLLASVNNWALALAEQGDCRAAVRMLDQGSQLAPHHELFQANLLAIYQRWFDELVAGQHSEEAVQLVEAAHRTDPAWRDLAVGVYRRHAFHLAEQHRVGEALEVLEAARARWGACSQLAATETELRAAAKNHPAAASLGQ